MYSRSCINLFCVHIDGLNAENVLQRITDRDPEKPFWIVTVNPEILLFARKHPDYRKVINSADLRIADGVGIQATATIVGKRVRRVTGVDLAERLIAKYAEGRGLICFVGGSGQTSADALVMMHKRYPDLIGQALQGGNVLETGAGDDANDEALHQITLMAPKLLLVAFGHPKQEMWIVNHLNDIPSVEVVIGVGGAFDYWSGNVPRAPKWMRALGFEWLHRLVTQPKRWRRIWNAVIAFPVLCVVDALSVKSK
jgi:N-acetylglucosaminyldiphosphoundecaprenol N-acetyl-beta-D-mannosaminyltransferase